MNEQNNGTMNGNNLPANNGKTQGGLKAFFGGLRRKYDAVRYSTAGKWIVRGVTLLTIGATGKVCYDKGKASVKPTIVTIEKIPESEAETTPAEEVEAEETV